ncbi:MAG TPA: hypothetical protein VNL69_12440, partial [Bacteroidota bacterium]|nr:hypothetical protein [Bacteroidota bacterium]
LNPAPDADYHSVGPENFSWIVNAMAEFAIKTALNSTREVTEYRWARFLNGDVVDRKPQPAPSEKRK